MYGFNFIIRDEMKISLFIDKNNEFYHYSNLSFNYDLRDDEWDIINEFGKENIIKTVVSMAVYETIKLTDIVKLVRFQWENYLY